MNERRERGWRGEWDALPERPTCAPLQAACRRPLTKPPLMRWRPGLFCGRDAGKGANPHSLKGVTFCTVRWRGLGPGSGLSGQEVDAGDKSLAPAKSESTWRAPRAQPTPCSPAGREAAPPLGSAQHHRLWAPKSFPGRSTSACLSLGL